MCNTIIAKSKLKRLTSRTEKDLYLLRYESNSFTPLTEDTLYLVRDICNDNNILCPLYKWSGEIKFKHTQKDFYNSLKLLATEYSIVFNLKNIY